MYSIDNQAGRLIEARLSSPLTTTEVDSIVQRVRMHIIALPGKAVCCCDLRTLDALPREASEPLIQMFTRDNAKIERSGFLLARSLGALGIQLQRIIRSAGNPARMTFDDAPAFEAWLGEVLTGSEKSRMHAFLESAPR